MSSWFRCHISCISLALTSRVSLVPSCSTGMLLPSSSSSSSSWRQQTFAASMSSLLIKNWAKHSSPKCSWMCGSKRWVALMTSSGECSIWAVPKSDALDTFVLTRWVLGIWASEGGGGGGDHTPGSHFPALLLLYSWLFRWKFLMLGACAFLVTKVGDTRLVTAPATAWVNEEGCPSIWTVRLLLLLLRRRRWKNVAAKARRITATWITSVIYTLLGKKKHTHTHKTGRSKMERETKLRV